MSNRGRSLGRLVAGLGVVAVIGSVEIRSSVTPFDLDTELVSAAAIDSVSPHGREAAADRGASLPADAGAHDGASDPMAPGETRFAFGDDQVLDDLWLRCEGGSGKACDELFERSPVGSDYERFGLSCGDRAAVFDCQLELDGRAAPIVIAENFDPVDSRLR